MSSAELKAKGNDAFAKNQYDDAISFYSSAISSPDASDMHILYSNRCACYTASGKNELALQDGIKCVELKPDWAKGYSRKGMAELQLGKLDDALATFRKGLEFDPVNKFCQDGVAECNRQLKKVQMDKQMYLGVMKLLEEPKFKQYQLDDPTFTKKVLDIMQLIVRDPNPQNLSMALTNNPDPRVKEAIAKLLGIPESATTNEPRDADNNKSSSPSTQQPTSTSQSQDMSQHLTEEQKQAEAFKAEANDAYKRREFELALSLYDKAIEHNSSEIIYYGNKAAVYLEMGNYEQCLTVCQEALDKRYDMKSEYSKVAKIFNRMAACFMRMDNYPQAISMYEKSLTEDNNKQTRTLLRECQRLYEKKQADEYLNPELAETHRTRGNSLFKKKEYPAAKIEYDESIKRNPKDPKAYSNRAATFMHLLEYPSALRDCERCLELDPQFVRAYARKGEIHLRLKENHKALAAFEKGLSIDPTNEECRVGLQNTLSAVGTMQDNGTVDEEQVNRAMADPEIQRLLSDPQFRLILGTLSQDASRLPEYLADPKIAGGIQKLMAAGILKVQ